MRTNQLTQNVFRDLYRTHEGGQAAPQSALEELTRAVSNCLLWENTFYESGENIAKRIEDLCRKVTIADISKVAMSARHDLFLRHVPLFLVTMMCKLNSENNKSGRPSHDAHHIVDTIESVIQRPDELTELLSIYYKMNPRVPKAPAGAFAFRVPRITANTTQQRPPLVKNAPIPAAMKRGLALAFEKFDEYRLAKYNRLDRDIKLRDVLLLVHGNPGGSGRTTIAPDLVRSGRKIRGAVARHDSGKGDLWRRLINNELATPDTWEVQLSAGADKKATWERLIAERKLGYTALLSNLRNMIQANVNEQIVHDALIHGAARSKEWPFRYITAAKHAPSYAESLSAAMTKAVEHLRLPGKTAVLVDISPSMNDNMSAKSKTQRWEAATGLAILLREVTPLCRIWAYSNDCREVANIRGLGLVQLIKTAVTSNGTMTDAALKKVHAAFPDAERIVCITDEQAHDGIHTGWGKHNFLINVGPYAPGLDISRNWIRVNGWSPRILDWMVLQETGNLPGYTNNTEEESDDN